MGARPDSSRRRRVTPADAARWTATLLAVAFFGLWACPPGSSCKTGAECDSGYCVQGVCCATECPGVCEECSSGYCTASADITCPSNPNGEPCGGFCDGANGAACVYAGPETECSPGSCDAATNTVTPAGFCDGEGSCFKPAPQSCAPLMCGLAACDSGCALDSDCQPTEFCAAGACVAKLPLKEPCGADAECESGFCVDGICCGSACTGQCEACDVTGSEGTCAPTTGAPHGGRPPCAGAIGSLCAGKCDGTTTTACVYPGPETVCPNPTGACTTAPDVCDGKGSCYSAPENHCPDTGGAAGAAGAAGAGAAAGTGGSVTNPGPCGCRAAGEGTGVEGWLAGLLVGAALMLRSRRKQRAAA